MTSGKILRKITVFALPCILGRVLQNLYTLVDTVVSGWAIDSQALAAVGAAGSIVSLFTDTVIGLMSGFSVATAKKYGAGDRNGLRKVYANSLIAALFASVAITVFGFVFAESMLVMLRTPAELMDNAVLYLRVIFIGITTSVLYNFLCEMLRAVGNSREPLVFLVAASVFHIALIVLFAFTLQMGVVGAALSTVVSQGAAAAMCFAYIKKHTPEYKISLSEIVPEKKVMSECLHIGIPMAITNFVVSFGVIILSFVTNGIGTEYVTAYSCASKIGYILTTPIMGYAAALSVFASQNLGAGKTDRIRKGVRQTLAVVTAVNCVIFTIFLFAAKPLLGAFIQDNSNAVEAGVMYLRVRCTAMFLLAPAAIFKNVLIGLGKPKYPTASGFMEIAVRYAVPITLSSVLGFACVPLTDAAAWLMLAVFLAPAYASVMKKIEAEQNAGSKLKIRNAQ